MKAPYTRKSLPALLLVLCMALFALPAMAQEFTATSTRELTIDLPAENDELFAAYINQELGYGISMFGMQAGARLGAQEKVLYDMLKAEIEDVAAGRRSSTKFTYTPSDIPGLKYQYTAADLNVGAIISGGSIAQEAKDAASAAFYGDYAAVMSALLHDCPYELYWYDKTGTGGMSISTSFSATSTTISISSFSVTLHVASAYQGGSSTTVKTANIGAITEAAQAIVDKYASLDSDEEKLIAYCNEICAMTSYNDEAADDNNNTPYGDPWQLIYVFDGNAATEVVCEGYSKAFQYLCDLTAFENASCITVSGQMAGGTGAGAHMWNVVTLDGVNYLADVTNSDTGTVGQNGGLFLSLPAYEAYPQYNFTAGNSSIAYVYDGRTLSLWDEESLTLGGEVHVCDFTNGVVTYAPLSDTQHNKITQCSGCSETRTEPESHTASTPATCLDPAVCAFCGESYGGLNTDNHTSSDFTYAINGSDAGKHDKKYLCCGVVAETTAHSTDAQNDRAATCESRAYCSVCDSEYGEKDAANHASDEFTCSDAGNGMHHSLICPVCGQKAGEEAHKLTYTSEGAAIAAKCSDCSAEAGRLILTAPESLVYDGTEKAVAVSGSIFGVTMPEVTYDGDRRNVTEEGFTASLVIGTATATLNVKLAKAAAYVTSLTAAERAYDGTVNVTVTGGTVGGVIANDEAILDLSAATAVVADAGAGQNKPVVVSGVKLGGAAAGNYALQEQMPDVAVNITPAPLAITSAAIADVPYNAQGIYTLDVTDVTFSGLVNNETLAAGTDYTAVAVLTGANAPDTTADAKVTIALMNGNYALAETEFAAKVDITIHKHSWSCTANGDTIIAKCGNTDGACPVENAAATITLTAPDELTYNGEAKTAAVVQTPDGAFGDLPAVSYCCAEGCINAGTHTASLTYGDATATLTFEIAQASIADAEVTVDGVFTYTGAAHEPAPIVKLGNTILTQDSDYIVSYANNTNAGNATVTITGVNNYAGAAAGSFAISKAAATVIAPQAVSGLAYTGSAQALVTAGSTTGGTLLYSLDGETWSEDIPAAAAAGNYTVHYKVDGGNNYEDVAAQTVSVTIGKGISGLTAVPVANTLTYNGAAQQLVSGGAAGAGTLLYSLEENGAYAAAIPTATNAGSYTVWYYVQGGDNYDDSEKAAVYVTIAPLAVTLVADDASYSKTYDGTAGAEHAAWIKQVEVDGLAGAAIQVTLDALPDYPDSAVGSYEAEIGISLSGDEAPNYKLNTNTFTATAIIEPKPLTAVAAEYTRAYNAGARLEAVPLTLTGVIPNDDVSATADFQLGHLDVGEYTEATLWTEPVLTGAAAGNYTLDVQEVTFARAVITKAAADKWSYEIVTPQDILVGSGLHSIAFPGSGTGIGNEVVMATGVTFYTDAAMNTPATDADVSALAEGEGITLYYKADAQNYESRSGAVELSAIDHKHAWTYSVQGGVITARCSGAIGTCPVENATATITLTAPDELTYDGEAKIVTVEQIPGGTFGDLPAVEYTGNCVDAGQYTASMTYGNVTATLTFEIAKAVIDSVAFDGSVDAPAAGATPDTAIDGGAGYSAAISWNPADAVFGYNTAYTATVTLTADGNHQFAGGIAQQGWNVSVNGDKTAATFTRAFDATGKAKLLGLTHAPENQQLTGIPADAAAAIAMLPAAVTYTAESGDVTVRIEWACSDYSAAGNAVNSFTWSVKAGELDAYDANGQATSGSVSITNGDKQAVTHKATDDEITYDGSTYDVSAMFTVDPNAGEASYEIMTGSTGAGELNGSVLTITRAGTLSIRLTTAANDTYAAGEAVAMLTVHKGSGSASVTLAGWTYGETANAPVPVSATNGTDGVSYQYKVKDAQDSTYTGEAPVNAGSYTVLAAFAANDLYEAVSAACDFAIAPRDITGETLTIGGFDAMTYSGAAQTPTAKVMLGTLEVSGYWSDVTNVADKTVFTASGNFTGASAGQTTGMAKAVPTAADFDVTLPGDLIYDGKAKSAAVAAKDSVAGMGAIAVEYDPADPTDVGSYKVLLSVAEGENYTAVTQMEVGSFAITRSDVGITAKADAAAYTYGDVITVTGTVGAAKQEQRSNNLFRVFAGPTAQQIALYDANGNQLTDGVDVRDGAYSITYDTKLKGIAPAESIILTVKFVGDANMANQSVTTDAFSLSAKPVTPVLNGAATKAYDGTTAVLQNHGLTIGLTGAFDGDKISASGSFAYADAAVGAGKTITASGITLGGDHAGFYVLSANTAGNAGGEITKARLTGVSAPVDQMLNVYCADVAAAIAQLPATVTYSVEGGGSIALHVSWRCENYSNTPNAENTFTWTVDDAQKLACYEPDSGVKTHGSIKLKNNDAIPVTLTGKDASITYDGSTFDVSAMFTIGQGAGTPSYEIAAGGTGAGTLSGSVLTMTKAGTIIIKLTTAESGAYAASTATATLTVAKGIPAVTAPTGLTAYYSQTLSQITLPADAAGIWNWEEGNAFVGEAGQQVHKAVFTPKETDLWNAVQADVTVNVVQAGTVFVGDAGVYNGETTTKAFTYGDTITVKVKPAPAQPAAFSLRALLAPQADQMALYIRANGTETQITDPVTADKDGVYTMEYATAGKALIVGGNKLVVKYVGSGNMASYEQEIEVTLAQKALSFVSITAQSRAYEQGNNQVSVTGATLNGIEAGDSAALDTAGLTAAVSSDAVAAYDSAVLPADVSLIGDDAGYYFISGGVSVAVAQGVEITMKQPAALMPELSQTSFVYNGNVQKPTITIKDGEITLIAGTDYDIVWPDESTDIGEKTIRITFKGNYSGEVMLVYEIVAQTPIIIVSQPVDQFVAEGQRAEFSIEANGAGLTYQWFIDRNDGSGWQELDGAVGAVYMTSVTDLNSDGFQYECLITDQYGNTLQSDAAVLHVSRIPALPETGDSSTPMLWLAMGMLSMLGIVLLRKKAYRR